ncbi:MAG: lipopolysaccharide transport periplasmic protein LptA [Gammaproteobacteria bacterium]|nr:lipopolysaccharide transport periplasmic protein LptA [Gammaproteobacteria bacterium]MDH5728561.1 lipopolysaccharide transport periplasmic protein LptA [Gammaproteobacteria bacterium]
MKLINAFLLFLLSLFGLSAWALSSDKNQPIQIEADQVKIDDRTGLSTYQGNVRLNQGSMLVHAEKVIVHSENRKLTKVIADGNPARFSQRPDGALKDVEATAQHVEYETIGGVLTLKEKAKFQQGSNFFQGNLIVYETHLDVVRASKSPQGKGRVQVVIEPQTLENAKQ